MSISIFFVIIPIISLNNFFYNKIVVGVIKKRIYIIFFCYMSVSLK